MGVNLLRNTSEMPALPAISAAKLVKKFESTKFVWICQV